MSAIEIVRASTLSHGDNTDGITRMKAFDQENVMVSQSKIGPKTVSGWHHHGTRQLYGFLVSGRLRLECLDDASRIVEISPGDFFHIPAGLVHRDLNPDTHKDAIVSTILVGTGPSVVNLERP